MATQDNDADSASEHKEMSAGKVLGIALGLVSILGAGATAGTYLITNSEISAKLTQAETERDSAKKSLAVAQQENSDLKAVVANEGDAAKVLPGWQAALGTCKQQVDAYKQKDNLLGKLQDLEERKASVDDGITDGYEHTSYGIRKIGDAEIPDLRTQSVQYQEQILNLQSRLQCEGKAQ